jgi:WD40 repeat protein
MTMVACGTDAGGISTWSLASGMLLTVLGPREGRSTDTPQHGSQHGPQARLLHPVEIIRSLRSNRSPFRHSSSVTALLFSASGRHLVSGDAEGRLLVWDMCTAQAVRWVHAFTQGVVALAAATSTRQDPPHQQAHHTAMHGQHESNTGTHSSLSSGRSAAAAARGASEALPTVLALGIISRGAGCLALWDMEAGLSLCSHLGGDALDTQVPGRPAMIEEIGQQVSPWALHGASMGLARALHGPASILHHH